MGGRESGGVGLPHASMANTIGSLLEAKLAALERNTAVRAHKFW